MFQISSYSTDPFTSGNSFPRNVVEKRKMSVFSHKTQTHCCLAFIWKLDLFRPKDLCKIIFSCKVLLKRETLHFVLTLPKKKFDFQIILKYICCHCVCTLTKVRKLRTSITAFNRKDPFTYPFWIKRNNNIWKSHTF